MARKRSLSQPGAFEALDLDTLVALRERPFRNQTGCFFADGARFLLSAVEAGWTIRHLVIAPKLLRSCAAACCVRHLRRQGVPVLEFTAEQYGQASLHHEPQGVGAVVEQRWVPLIEQRNPRGLWVGLDAVRHPGNLGTILRTADAVGASGVMLIGGETDPYDPASVRASMGAIFRQGLIRTSARSIIGWKSRTGCTVVGASPDGSKDFRRIPYARPMVLMMGSERAGLRPKQEALCDHLARIPITGRADSLNLAVATGLMLYEAFRGQVADQ